MSIESGFLDKYSVIRAVLPYQQQLELVTTGSDMLMPTKRGKQDPIVAQASRMISAMATKITTEIEFAEVTGSVLHPQPMISTMVAASRSVLRQDLPGRQSEATAQFPCDYIIPAEMNVPHVEARAQGMSLAVLSLEIAYLQTKG